MDINQTFLSFLGYVLDHIVQSRFKVHASIKNKFNKTWHLISVSYKTVFIYSFDISAKIYYWDVFIAQELL